MKKYYRTQTVEAAPAYWEENKTLSPEDVTFDAATMTEGYSVIVGPKHTAFYTKDLFERTFRDEEHLTFGMALEALKGGRKVARQGWNGKGVFLFLLPAGTIPKSAIHDETLMNVLEDNGKDCFEALGSIRMKTADDKILTGWLASQTDMLAEDWRIVE